jgi:hypothetical protein
VVARLATFGAEPAGGAPEVLEQVNASEYAQMGRLMKELHISAASN